MSKRRPNWLLRGLIGVSLAIHIVIFFHISGLYNSKALSYIELTMQNISKPTARAIPRPRHRPKPPKPRDVKRLKVFQCRMPRFKPIKMEPAEKNLPDSLMESISMPDTASLQIADWTPGALVASGDCMTAQSYLEMVRLKIERHKKYPDIARVKNIEGSVVVRFVITPDGGIREVEVAKRSRNRALDLAALRAVQNAAPFPKLPRHLFKGEIPLELTIVFELT
ncbi:MAG: energy transducer TonB [Proteobacteria bacterium]|nr:energy transducer TonB [Pseudomonadota bacterium]